MSEDQDPFDGAAPREAASALRCITDDAAKRAELLRHWDRLDRNKRKLLLLLAREMGDDPR